jgi:geranylgeranyl pyrophosphate synthase
VSKLRRLIEESGSLDYAKGRVKSYTGRAREAIGSVPDCRARSRLLELTDYLASRYY